MKSFFDYFFNSVWFVLAMSIIGGGELALAINNIIILRRLIFGYLEFILAIVVIVFAILTGVRILVERLKDKDEMKEEEE